MHPGFMIKGLDENKKEKRNTRFAVSVKVFES